MSKLKSQDELFAGRHFGRDAIILWARWYLRYKLSLRDLAWFTKRVFWVTRTSGIRPPAGGFSVKLRGLREGLCLPHLRLAVAVEVRGLTA